MGLSQEDILRLLAPKPRASKGKPKIDTSIRTVETWFALAHKMFDEDRQEMAKCENPDCPDVRTRVDVVSEVNGKKMCRICFLSGWNNG